MSNVHNIRIEPIDDQPSTGYNTRILIDGMELKGVTGIVYEVSAGHVARLKLDIEGNFEVLLKSEIQILNPELDRLRSLLLETHYCELAERGKGECAVCAEFKR